MTSNVESRPLNDATSAECATLTANVPASATAAEKPAIIATRQRCEADGVGLSHYILMDRKAGR